MLCFKLKHKTAFITIELIKKGVYGICGHVQAALMPFVCKIDNNKGENENHKKKPPILLQTACSHMRVVTAEITLLRKSYKNDLPLLKLCSFSNTVTALQKR